MIGSRAEQQVERLGDAAGRTQHPRSGRQTVGGQLGTKDRDRIVFGPILPLARGRSFGRPLMQAHQMHAWNPTRFGSSGLSKVDDHASAVGGGKARPRAMRSRMGARGQAASVSFACPLLRAASFGRGRQFFGVRCLSPVFCRWLDCIRGGFAYATQGWPFFFTSKIGRGIGRQPGGRNVESKPKAEARLRHKARVRGLLFSMDPVTLTRGFSAARKIRSSPDRGPEVCGKAKANGKHVHHWTRRSCDHAVK